MNKEALINEARTLPVPGMEAGKLLDEAVDPLAKKITHYMLAQPDLASLIGKGNEMMMETNHGNHFKYIASLASLFDPTTLVETVLWVFRTYRSHGFDPQYWKVMLPEATNLIREILPEHQNEIIPIYEWLLRNVDNFALLSETTSSFFEEMSTVHGVLDENGS
ncbi:MAG: hypothetical protein AB7E51_17100 [Pseudodesulfovibrio sp.]|uniref:hypothetical protein n=1 Tax=Pseudodesulfovibrio sp. TaxID=2035812 RepID=UPI003D0F93E8